MEIQRRESRYDSLELEVGAYLKKETVKKCKKTKGQLPLAAQQRASEADTLYEIDRVISKDNSGPAPKK